LRFIAYYLRARPYYSSLLFASRLMLLIGIFFGGLAILAGMLAANVVGPKLCWPQILVDHAALAITAILFSFLGLVGDWARDWITPSRFRKIVVGISYILLIVGAVFLILASMVGGMLVYQQGAAVIQTCTQENL
jgi:hypothetical protein